MSIVVAFKAFFRALFSPSFSSAVAELLAQDSAASNTPASPPAVDPMAVQMLALLQREGRLLDFLQEDLDGSPDAVVGDVVKRTVHKGCRDALKEYLKVAPVMEFSEGQTVTVDAGFDPNSIRLVGKVEGDPPFHGILRHPGWKVVSASLPTPPATGDASVVCPAEVEIQ